MKYNAKELGSAFGFPKLRDLFANISLVVSILRVSPFCNASKMKSPICYLCNKDFDSEFFHFQTGGDLVRFADYNPLPEGAAGHPHGLEWFCNQHLQAAQALASMSVSDALALLQNKFGKFPAYQPKPHRDPELWVTSVGPHPAKVFAILRQASQISPAEAKKMLMSGTFMVAHGWPRDFRGWQAALVEAEAEIEIRCP